MKYAVISLGGKQHVVSEGETLQIDRLDATPDETLTIKDVLLTVDGDTMQMGAPLVEKASVTLKVVSHDKGDKIRVAKFKAKSRYRRVQGHRQALTTVQVVSIA